ncbi:hypothetical protein ACUZIR_004260 [Enterobacter asburiae]
MERELNALASLKRNVRFWFDACGCNENQVKKQVEAWFDFAYAPSEQERARKEVLSLLDKDHEE